jgi:hypothetical protein
MTDGQVDPLRRSSRSLEPIMSGWTALERALLGTGLAAGEGKIS